MSRILSEQFKDILRYEFSFDGKVWIEVPSNLDLDSLVALPQGIRVIVKGAVPFPLTFTISPIETHDHADYILRSSQPSQISSGS